MTTEAKKCPFCGGADVGVFEGSTFRWMFAECRDCGAQAGEVRVQTIGSGTREEWKASGEARAIEEWNKRTEVTTPPAASGAAPALPRYTEWVYLRKHGQWSNQVPGWAKDYRGRMNDTVAAHAVIEELGATLASRESSPAALTDEMHRVLVIAEATLADIGDADREPGDDVAWCEARAAEALPVVRAMLKTSAAALASPQVAPALSDERKLINIALGLMDAPAEANIVSATSNLLSRVEEMQSKVDDYDRLASLAQWRRGQLEQAGLSAFQSAAAPVQVAPATKPAIWLTQKEFDVLSKAEKTERETVPLYLAAPMQTGAAADDARDAAEALGEDERSHLAETLAQLEADGQTTTDYETLMEWAQQGFLRCKYFEITPEGWKATAPAAKPAEPTLPTQGDASHD